MRWMLVGLVAGLAFAGGGWWTVSALGQAGETRVWEIHQCNASSSGADEPCDPLTTALYVNGSARGGWVVEVTVASDFPAPAATLSADAKGQGLTLVSPAVLHLASDSAGRSMGSFGVAPHRGDGEILVVFEDDEEGSGYFLHHAWLVTFDGHWPRPPVVAVASTYDGPIP